MIKLPKDAEGREIPLDTSEMFISDGTMVHAVKFEFIYHTCDARGTWFLYTTSTPGEYMTLQACDVYLTPPDSWEKLEEDLSRAAESDDVVSCCRYLSSNKCADCPIRSNDSACVHKEKYAFGDILNRIRKLRGDGDA